MSSVVEGTGLRIVLHGIARSPVFMAFSPGSPLDTLLL